MEEDLRKKDRKKQRRRSQAGQGKPDSRQQSASTDSRQQSAKFESETGDQVTTPPQEDDFPTEIPKEEPKTKTKRTVEVEKREFQTTEFSSVDPKEYGIEFEDEEFKFVPPQRDETLPDLRRLLDSLEDGETDLETKEDPPALFTGPTHIPHFTKISELKLEIEKAELGEYLDEFEEGVKDEVVMLGQISLDEVQEEEKRLRDEHIEYLDQEAMRKRDQSEEILKREEEAKKRLAIVTKQKRDDIARREEILKQKEKLLMDRLHRAFRRAESQLTSTLESRKGEVKTFYGDLMLADGTYGGSKGRRWKVDWDKTPQPIQVKLKCLRGVRDKLPGGRYVLMVSLYNRLGGHVLRWSKLKGQMWGAATLPINHDGQFYNVEMKMDQSVFTVLPSKASLRPGMVLTFELFLLRGSILAKDRVVAWGSFPICDGQFDVIEGKYKCPMLRGEMDPMLDKHDKTEELMASDLDHWMSNLYFEIIKLPRYLAGQKEFEVELHFTSSMVGYPDRVRSAEEYRDGEKPLPGSTSTMDSDEGSSASLSPTDSGTVEIRSEATASKVKLAHKDKKQEAQATTYGSRIINKDKKLKMAIGESSDESDDELAELAIRKEEDFKAVKGMPGMYYKQYQGKPVDIYHKKLYSMLPKTPLLAPNIKKKKLTHVEKLEEHSFAVQPPFVGKGRLARSNHEKLQYVGRQFLAELGLSQWRSREFWGMLLMFIVVFFIRTYMHYIGQWLFLNAISIPINKFNFLPYTVELNYQSNLLKTREEIAVVWLGPIMNILIFILLVNFCFLSQKLFGMFPDIGCKFNVAYGLLTLLDPLLIIIIDSILKRYINDALNPEADFMKLYWHFERSEGSGLAGIFITSFLYLFTMFMTASIIYMYFLRLHNNGRMLDVYWRLHGAEDNFFTPYDLEISNQELNYIVKKSEAWRGEEGERRKTAVYDYIWEEEDVEESIWDEHGVEYREVKPGRKEITTHVSIHTIHLDGLRELYRHFLRLPDGAVVEIFGDIAIPGMDKDIKLALEKGAKGIENLGSDSSFPKVHARRTSMSKSGFATGGPPSPTSSSDGSIRKKKLA